MFGVMLGVKVASGGEGYREIDYAPIPCEAIGHAEASYEYDLGVIRSAWRYTDSGVEYELDIPDGVVANVNIPGVAEKRVTGGKYKFFQERNK